MTKNKPRKYQDSFVQEKYEAIQKLLDKAKQEINFFALAAIEDETRICRRDKERILEYINNRTKIAYAQGFFYGWVLKQGDPLD